MAKTRGRLLESPKQIAVHLPGPLYDRLRQEADASGLGLSETIRRRLEFSFEEGRLTSRNLTQAMETIKQFKTSLDGFKLK